MFECSYYRFFWWYVTLKPSQTLFSCTCIFNLSLVYSWRSDSSIRDTFFENPNKSKTMAHNFHSISCFCGSADKKSLISWKMYEFSAKLKLSHPFEYFPWEIRFSWCNFRFYAHFKYTHHSQQILVWCVAWPTNFDWNDVGSFLSRWTEFEVGIKRS